uniref:Cytochrome P450 3638D1 n=1 Tax=Maconellicoccus hirsutus TaxID=177089 RepID=A0AAT9UU85_MACHI
MTNALKNMSSGSQWSLLIIIYTLSFFTIWYIFVYKWRTRRITRMLKPFTKVPALPIIGSLHLVSGNMRERMIKFFDLLNKYEFPLVAWLFHTPIIFVGSYKDIQTVLNNTHERDTFGIFKRALGGSISLLQGETWRKHRRAMTPAFSNYMLQQYLHVFNEQSASLAKKLKQLADNDEAFDIWKYVVNMNVDIITQNMTGHKLQLQEKGTTKFSEALFKSLWLESSRFTSPLLFPDFIYSVYLFVTGNGKCFKTIYEFSRQIVQDRLAQYNKEKKIQQPQNNDDEGMKGPKTLIDLLVKVHDMDPEFTTEHMRAELLNMITLGSDTSSLTVSFVLLMLAMHPEVQEKVYDEIKTVFGDEDRVVEPGDLKHLVYLEQCIRETLRKYNVLPATARKPSQDIVLSDKRVIPGGCHVIVAFHAAHLDREIFPNPETWDPEHFASDSVASQNRQVSFPFGAGLRSCIGARYAMISIKTQLVHLLRDYRFTTNMKMDDIQVIVDLVLRNDTGYWLKLWSRKKNKQEIEA